MVSSIHFTFVFPTRLAVGCHDDEIDVRFSQVLLPFSARNFEIDGKSGQN